MIGRTNAGGSGGGGLNLKVVGGTTQPTNPRENTIWVSTTTAITGYALSPTQPETGAEGLVWLKTADTGVEINVGRKNAVLLHLASGMLYSGGTWQMADAYVYVSEAWIKLDTAVYMIKDGVLQTTFNVTDGASLTQRDGYVQFKGDTTGYFAAWVDDIDLTNKSIVSINGTFDIGSISKGFCIAIWAPGTIDISYDKAKAFALYHEGVTNAELDVTNYTGTYTVGITSVSTHTQKITGLVVK